MARDALDFRITPQWDLALTPAKDLMTAQGRLYREQQARLRLSLMQGEWASDRFMGADLDELRGEENTRELGDEIISRVIRALTYDGLFLEEELSVDVVPLSEDEVLVRIEASDEGTTPQTFEVALHLLHGTKPLF